MSSIAASNEQEKLTEKLIDLISWADENPWFDQTFIMSLYDQSEKGRSFTWKQGEAIEKLYNKFLL